VFVNIDCMILVWEKFEDTRRCLLSIEDERKILMDRGYNVKTILVDNGSNKEMVRWLTEQKYIDILILNKENRGISRARNQALEWVDGDYVIMIDGDITPVYKSFNAMIEYIEEHKDEKIGCIGAASYQYTAIYGERTPCLDKIEKIDEGNQLGTVSGRPIAWTQYGVFLGLLFTEDKIRFVEEGEFGMPGYGFEDDILGLSIINRGYRILRFTDICYYHRFDSSMGHDGHLSLRERRVEKRRHLAEKIIAEHRVP